MHQTPSFSSTSTAGVAISCNQQLIGSNETEWLASAISHFIGGICGLSESSTQSSLIIATFTPTSVLDEIAPIPQKWQQTEQILKDVADDFDTEELFLVRTSRSNAEGSSMIDTSSPIEHIASPNNETTKQNQENRIEAFLEHPVCQERAKEINAECIDGFSSSNKKAVIDSAEVIDGLDSVAAIVPLPVAPVDSIVSSRTNISTNTPKAVLGTRSRSINSNTFPRQGIHGPEDAISTTILDSRKQSEYEEFGNSFHTAAIERLRLPRSLGLQMQRISELAKSANYIQKLEREKARVRNELKDYDQMFAQTFGSVPGREEKEPLRPLYMYYRRLKIAIQRSSARQNGEQLKSCSNTNRSDQTDERIEMTLMEPRGGTDDSHNSHSLTSDDKRLLKLQQDKAQIRHRLQQFQEDFVRTQGRPIKFHRDIVPIESEYKQYKQLKEHIRKLDEAIKRKKAFKKLSDSHLVTRAT